MLTSFSVVIKEIKWFLHLIYLDFNVIEFNKVFGALNTTSAVGISKNLNSECGKITSTTCHGCLINNVNTVISI